MPFVIILFVVAGLLAPFVVRAWRSRSAAPLIEAGWSVLAGVAAGVIWGAGARIAMRLVALAERNTTEFSLDGTLLILVTGAIFGVPLGLLFALVRRWLPGSGIGKGLAFGLILAAILLIPLASLGASDLDSNPIEAPVLLGVGLFGALFALHGAVMEAVIERRRPVAVGGPIPRTPTVE